ncbi:MAG: TetR/AcrR family transcriptional regulator [Chloroflexi bacterium]|nr:TetR/AcrR family transcriptional regulator [Chloroflexota bacterium]
MPRKNLFTKDMFVDAAFRIIRDKGRDKLSARSLARELKCSTMPVYSYLKSMKTLVNDLEEKAIDLMLTYQTTSSTGQPFLDMGLGYVLFARNEQNLFRFLFMVSEGRRRHGRAGRSGKETDKDLFRLLFIGGKQGSGKSGGALNEIAFSRLLTRMKTDPAVSGLDEHQLESILTKMWIFTHGLAFLVNNNLLINSDENFISDSIHETGRFVIEGEIKRKKDISGGP